MNEEQLHNIVTKHITKLDTLERTTYDQFCRHDAENDKYIVEYKCRRKFYDDSTQMEKPKFDVNIAHESKDYLYIVYDGAGKVQLWNVSKLDREGYDFDWKDKLCPFTTDFSNNEKVVKRTGYLKWDDAHLTLEVKPKNV